MRNETNLHRVRILTAAASGMLEAKVQMEVRVVSSGAEVGAPMEGQEPLISPAILPVALQAPGGLNIPCPS